MALPLPDKQPGFFASNVPLDLKGCNNDPNVDRKPDYYVHVICIAKEQNEKDYVEVRKPPLFPCVRLRKCRPDEDWCECVRIPNIVNEKYTVATDDDRQVRNRGYVGERVAQDLLNSTNLGTNVWIDIPDDALWLDGGGSDDLTRRGYFWTVNMPPTPEELAKAKARMEKHYRRLIAHAKELFRTGKSAEIGPEHHVAAEYFHVNEPWHVTATLPDACPNCGEDVKPGIAFHMSQIGVCIIDWRRAVEAGVKTMADVPASKRWWDEETASVDHKKKKE